MLYLFLLIFHLITLNGWCKEPFAVYLTWQKDPLTTMTIQWVTDLGDSQDSIQYWPTLDPSKKAAVQIGVHSRMPGFFPYLIHRAELSQLQPDTTYCFQLNEDEKIYRFKTMPRNLERPIQFVAGGDIYHDEIEYVRNMNSKAAATSPDFALLGGDIAYAEDRNRSCQKRWLDWLFVWSRTMKTPDGRLIPVIPAIGNHDVIKGFNQTPSKAPFFYALFDLPGYRTLDFGNYLSIIALDSGHTHPIEGMQTQWLEQVLAERQSIKHKIAFYHVPAYPSVRDFNYKVSQDVRRYWTPFFEKFGLDIALEHHDHAYKRTFPIKNRKVDPSGVLYLGDGAWGIKKTREPKKPKNVWYLARTAKKRHFINIKLFENKREFQAIDEKGVAFDSNSYLLQQTEQLQLVH